MTAALQILSIDQLVTYLRKLLPTDDKVAASEAEKKEVEVPKGEHDQSTVKLSCSPPELLFSWSWHGSCLCCICLHCCGISHRQ
jgi:hypothetical protein